MNAAKVTVTCPHCGKTQPEPRDAYSTVCKNCRQHFRLHESPGATALAAPKPPKPADTREVTCFQCGTLLEVAREAESTMCKRCSGHVDLHDYQIDSAVSKNFRTYGAFVIGEKGYVFNAEALVSEAVIKGRFHGKIEARRSLTIHSTAEIRGSFLAQKLIIPAGNHFHWKDTLELKDADIAGELAANVHAAGTIRVKATGLLFGDVTARNLVVESGAVVVGMLRIGEASPDTAAAAPPHQ